jgi:lipoate-protein ligase A
MGIDEAMLRNASEFGLASLRLYKWSGPWLSLGFAQRRVAKEKLEEFRRAGVSVVRRTSGGRAVLHGRDLTYCVAAPEHQLQPGLRGAYDQIAQALLLALHDLGVDEASRAPQLESDRRTAAFDCFAQPAGDEIVLGRGKLIGSAQRRRGGAVLQHGSIRIAADLPDVARATGVADGLALSLEESGYTIEERELRRALVDGFSKVFDTEFQERPLETWERDLAQQRCDQHLQDALSAPSSRKVRA